MAINGNQRPSMVIRGHQLRTRRSARRDAPGNQRRIIDEPEHKSAWRSKPAGKRHKLRRGHTGCRSRAGRMPTFRQLEVCAFQIRIESIAFQRKLEEPGDKRIGGKGGGGL